MLIFVRTLQIVFLLAFSAQTIMAQTGKSAIKIYNAERKKIDDYFKNPSKVTKSITTQDGQLIPNYERKHNLKKGYCQAEDYKLPKKVALLTFYIQDNDYKSYSQSGNWRTTYSHKSSGEKVNVTLQLIYQRSIEKLKAQYAELGMELQTSDEFLTSEKLKNSYYNHALPNLESRFSAFDLANEYSAIPNGYRLLPYLSVVGAEGKQFYAEKQQFFETLGFDAFIIVCINLTAAKNSINLISSSFFYRNPGWKASGKSGMIVGYNNYTSNRSQVYFTPPLTGLYLKEQKEITNAKGRQDIKLVTVDVDSRVSDLVVEVSCTAARSAIKRIEGKK